MTDIVKMEYKVVNGTSYHIDTPDDLVQVLEQVRHSGQRVLLMYGNVQTGEIAHELMAERGTIGRSTGDVKIPLLVKTRRSLGGGAISDSSILRVLASPGNRVLWDRKVST